MLDQYSRNIDYIRISVTDRCNLRCVYCMPQTCKTYLGQEELLTYDEIVKLAGIYRSLGIKNVKLTGGEPLVREHVDELIFRLKEECGMEKVTLTTNGILLEQQLDGLVKAGLDGVNISLDTLNPEHYNRLTGGCNAGKKPSDSNLEAVLWGMRKAQKQAGISVKVKRGTACTGRTCKRQHKCPFHRTDADRSGKRKTYIKRGRGKADTL